MTDSRAPVTATLTATGIADTSGQRRTPVPVTWFYRTRVRACPPPPTTTDQKVAGSSPVERASLTGGNASESRRGASLRRLRDCNRDSNRESPC